jgi:hypothetical protein
MVVVFDIEKSKNCLIYKNEFIKNKNRYISIHKNKVAVINKNTKEIEYIEVELLKKYPEKFVGINNGYIVAYDIVDQSWKRIKKEIYHRNKDRYKINRTDKVPVKTPDGSTKLVNREEFQKGNYEHITKGKITLKNKETGKIEHIPVEKYYENKEKYQLLGFHQYVKVKHRKTGKIVKIKKDFFNKNTHLFESVNPIKKYQFDPNKKITILNILTQETKKVSGEEFYKNSLLIGPNTKYLYIYGKYILRPVDFEKFNITGMFCEKISVEKARKLLLKGDFMPAQSRLGDTGSGHSVASHQHL